MATNTICISHEGPANALALNKDCSQVVIAGRNVFKVFAIGENEFTEVCNLRVGKNLNLNFSSIDVAWSAIEENTLATAATNGAVVVWNLGRSGRSKQEHVFTEHKRTVNKVSFHLTEPSLLISGSQDGTMKCFDLRMKEVARTFMSNTESVRDVQFCPGQPNQFAAVSENGSVQVWDVRKHDRCLHQFTAHSGPIFACDWHPEMPWLATASRDKTIKIWDMQAKPTLEHTIYTIASVGHVKWRPQRKYHISSCALVLDCAVHVWDVRRPRVPLATFAEHRDVATAVVWLATPYAFLSTSRDCSVCRHQFQLAAHPALWASGAALGVSALGAVTLAAPRDPLPRDLRRPAPTHYVRAASVQHRPPAPRKQPRAGALSAAAQATLERLFPTSHVSVLSTWGPPHPPPDGGTGIVTGGSRLPASAQRYRSTPAPTLAAAAKHNASVAKDFNCPMSAHVWEVVAALYGDAGSPPPPPQPPPPRAPPPPPPPRPPAVEEEPMEEQSEWVDSQFHNNGVLGLPTHCIYIPPAKFLAMSGDGSGWVSAASAHYVDVSAADWTLPEEAFPPRDTTPAHHPHPATPAPPAPPPDTREYGQNGSTSDSSPGGSSSDSVPSQSNLFTAKHDTMSVVMDGGCSRAGAGSARCGRLGARLAATLKHHAAAGDVQTPCLVLLLLGEHRNDLLPYIEESLQEQWLLSYIELLHRYKLYNIATEVVMGAWVACVSWVSQQSTSVWAACGACGRRAACARCRRAPERCAVCTQVVRGVFAWCQGCSHGGHVAHMRRWLNAHRTCPAGCGHRCRIP